jgi:hypothetical protein
MYYMTCFLLHSHDSVLCLSCFILLTHGDKFFPLSIIKTEPEIMLNFRFDICAVV